MKYEELINNYAKEDIVRMCEQYLNTEALVGEPCYKFYGERPRHRHKGNYHFFIDNEYTLKWYLQDRQAKVLIEPRVFCKSDIGKIGRFAFRTEAEAKECLKGKWARYRPGEERPEWLERVLQ